MNWILEHFQVVIALIVIAAWILRSIAGAEQEERPKRSGRAAPAEDAAEAERTRQIQEEIRRRILARQRGETVAPPNPPPMPAAEAPPPMPVFVEPEEEEELLDPDYPGEGPREPMPSAARREAEAAQAAILEQQRQLAEQLRALREARSVREASSPPSRRVWAGARHATTLHRQTFRSELIRDLHEPVGLRRAILLKEILGEPLALRRDSPLPRP